MCKKIVIGIIMGLVMVQTAYAFQFRDFRWGANMGEVERALKSEYEWIRKENDRTIIISDRVANEPAQIDFIFTPKTKILCAVIIRFEKDVNYKLIRFLTDIYGKPIKDGFWIDTFSAIQLKGDYSHLNLIYMHLDLYELFEQEMERKEKA